jgi:26S proteasome regulatory subunit N5
LCGEYEEWDTLNEYIALIAKKRSQSKQAITKMVQAAMEFIDKTPTKEARVELINTLRRVTEGKIYVEVERARLVHQLAQIKEQDGEVAEAAKLMQDVQIETIGSMEAHEKIDFILQQMRLTLDANDYVRAIIISRKITARSLLDPKHQDLKIRYYNLLIRYYSEKKDYLEICKAHQSIYNTPKVQEDPKLWVEQLQHMVLFVLLAKYDNHQNDLMHRIAVDKNLDEPPMVLFKTLMKQFTSSQIINWPEFQQTFGNQLAQHAAFTQRQERYEDLHNRVVEHNLRIIAKYYTKIHIARLAKLLFLDDARTEKFVSEMVTSKTISAKVDRIAGVIEFKQQAGEDNDVLNDWSHDTQDLLQLLEKTNHLINKDYMIHQANKKGKK